MPRRRLLASIAMRLKWRLPMPLFAKAEELLNGIETPLTPDDVAEYLQIPKKLAGDWLKRLEQEGKYRKQTRPVRYSRNL